MTSLRRVLFSLIGFSSFAACSSTIHFDGLPDAGLGGSPEGGIPGIPAGQAVNQACDETNVCRPGLTCTASVCQPSHASTNGTACVISAECTQGAYCGPTHTCAAAGNGGDGVSCKSDANCTSGFRCNISGLGLACKAEGHGDVASTCATSGDCFGGLVCAQHVCAPLPVGVVSPIALPTWTGAPCKDDDGPVKAYFSVPRGTAADGDFFRLPFPNDIRLANGHPSMTGFPTPGDELLGFDVVDRYVKDVEANADGFSVYPTVTMRFSGSVDIDSLKTSGAVRFIDLTANSDIGLHWSATTGRSAYVCNNSISTRPIDGAPLVPGHTYAVLITNLAHVPGGGAIQRSADLTAVLSSTPPTDPALTVAALKYVPLRGWAQLKSFDLNTIVNAATFTVGHTTRAAEKIAATIAAAAAPTATNWVKCGGATPSPCPDATGDRACGATDPDFEELHALVSLPIFQKGTAPYLTPADGGDIGIDGSGAVVQRTEQVCLALTIPKNATMPASGWPVVVYAHGTGGSFRSHVTDGTARALARVDNGSGGQAHLAVLGIDQVQHGPRRAGSTMSPDDLFFNFTNPGAARGNPLQGAADQMSLVKFAHALDLTAGASPTGAAIKFDTVAYWGHSQGATEGGIALPYVEGVKGAVLSGAGASLIDALLTKTSPVNIAQAVPFVLEDPAGVSQVHPVLSLLQNSIDPGDPLSHGRAIAAAPGSAALGKHLFVPYGQNDTYAPPKVQATFILASGLGLAAAPASVTTADAIGSLVPVAVPPPANLGTLVGYAREYTPHGFDGHFVAYQDADGQKDVTRFLADATGNVVPRIGR